MKRLYFLIPDKQGLALGGSTGILAGLVAVVLPPASKLLPLATTSILGQSPSAGVGAWLGGMVGMNVGNRRTKEFKDTIESAELNIPEFSCLQRINKNNNFIDTPQFSVGSLFYKVVGVLVTGIKSCIG